MVLAAAGSDQAGKKLGIFLKLCGHIQTEHHGIVRLVMLFKRIIFDGISICFGKPRFLPVRFQLCQPVVKLVNTESEFGGEVDTVLERLFFDPVDDLFHLVIILQLFLQLLDTLFQGRRREQCSHRTKQYHVLYSHHINPINPVPSAGPNPPHGRIRRSISLDGHSRPVLVSGYVRPV